MLQPVQGQESAPACQQALACVTLPRAGDTAGKELPQEPNTTKSLTVSLLGLLLGRETGLTLKGLKGRCQEKTMFKEVVC